MFFSVKSSFLFILDICQTNTTSKNVGLQFRVGVMAVLVAPGPRPSNLFRGSALIEGECA
jgi:hypothetical protein